MRFLVLGPLEVVSGDGASIPLGGRKQRRLLSLLLLHANHVVERDQLIEVAWADRPPPSAQESLDAYVYRLRRLLGGERIARRDGGYMVRVGPGELDADDFEQLVVQASGAAKSGEYRAAIAATERALALCRGAAWPDLDGDLSGSGEALRLAELRLGATEALLEGKLALGAGEELVPELEQLCRENPLRERPLAALMLSLYRAGRQTDALASYRERCEVLREELGLQPSESLRELEMAILRHDPSLLAPSAGMPSNPAGRLPVPTTPFLGRANELSEVTALVWGAGGRLVTLTGPGGSGKTRLALRAAQACAEDYRGGAWFVGFADLTDPQLITPVICQALGVVEQPGLTPAQRLEEYLRDRELLLVLDNLEQLASGAGALGELLSLCPGVRILATSREPLHLAGEQQYEVPGLDREDAIELFIARAKQVAPSLAVERESAGAVCERLDRLPLAIELAAARTKILSTSAILARLERQVPVLATGPRDAPRRQRTLQATIDWSYGMLAEDEQRLFARLSVFAGGCTLAAAEAVCDAELDTLEGLVDRSLVRADGGRYRMLQTLREYALDKLTRFGEQDHIRRRHARWCVELIEPHGLTTYVGPEPGGVRLALAVQERENFRVALEWAQREGEIETVARVAAPLTPAWTEQGRLSEAGRWLGVARGRSTEFPLSLQAAVLSAARVLACELGAHEASGDLCDQAIAIYRQLGDVGGVIRETISRSAVAGDLHRSRTLLAETLRLAREHDLPRARPHALAHLAGWYEFEGRLDRARALYERVLALASNDSPGLCVVARVNLAHLANLERRHTDAAALAQEALEQARAIGVRRTGTVAALEFAWSLAELQQPERATRILGAALEFYRDGGTFMQSDEVGSEQAMRDALGAQLDEHTVQALLDEGRTMTVEQAVREVGQPTAQRA